MIVLLLAKEWRMLEMLTEHEVQLSFKEKDRCLYSLVAQPTLVGEILEEQDKDEKLHIRLKRW